MDSVSADRSNLPPSKDPSTSPPVKDPERQSSASVVSEEDNPADETSSKLSSAGLSSWAKSLKIPQPFSGSQDDLASENSGKSTFARFTSNLASRLSPRQSPSDESSNEAAGQSNLIESFTKGLVDSSRNAVKAVQVKARHVVSQNKRRYQVLFLINPFFLCAYACILPI